MAGAWKDLDGQKTFFGETISVCDICGKEVRGNARHPKCQAKADDAPAIVRKWMRKANLDWLQGKPVEVPTEIRTLARLAKIQIS